MRLGVSSTARTATFDRAFAPFGEVYNSSGLNYPDFTGDTSEAVRGTYDTPNRELNPNQGRWISTDPAGLSAVSLSNPQSWNRYAYVTNQPLTAVDPSGLACYPIQSGGSGDCSGTDNNVWSFEPNILDAAIGCDPVHNSFCIFQPRLPQTQNIFTGENSVNVQIGSGNPLTDIWRDALGLPTLPCQAQFGPWCDPSMLPDPWVLDAEKGSPRWTCTPGSPGCYNVPYYGGVPNIQPQVLMSELNSIGEFLLGEFCSGSLIAKASLEAHQKQDEEIAGYSVLIPEISVPFIGAAGVEKLSAISEGHLYNWFCQ